MSSDNIAIRVSHLSKQYRLGGPQEPYHTLRDAIVNSLKAPMKVFHKAPPLEGFWALKDVSFEVEPSEVVGIIGRNGAGKSTLLKILSRITSPTEGSVELHGRIGSLLEVGTGFHPELTGRENVYLSGSILGMKRMEIDAKLDDIVKFSEIEKFLDTPVKRYSSGMYVRLAFAVAAHLDTDILLVDEVLAVGDVAFQKKSLSKMRNVTSEGRTVLIVSHSMPIIRNNCEKVLYLKNGIVDAYDDPNIVINSYLNTANEESRTLIKEISPSMHVTGISKICVKKIQIIDENENILEHIKYHQPIIIEAFMEVLDNVVDVGFGITISTIDNAVLLQTHCFDKSGLYWDLYPGSFKIRIYLLNSLKKGYYSLQFGAHQKPFNLSLFDIPNVLKFEVTDDPFDLHEHYSQFNAGLVDAASEWAINKC
jgi:lipopolysaccharide transport system ATP-binding protein